MQASSSPQALRFGAFEVDAKAGELRKQGLKVRLAEQPFQVLAALLERPGEVVTREDLRQRLWSGDTFVDFDHSLNNCINKLREALGDSAGNPRFIETLARRGYRFVAPVETVAEPTAVPAPIHEPARWRWSSRQLAGVAACVVLVLAALGLWLRGKSESDPIRSLAVLPLENFSGDPAQEYLADSMTDQLITDLASIGALRVTSRTSVMRYKGARKPLKEIAANLSVDAIVEGSLLRSGSHVRITAQLVHAGSDRHLWAETYEGDIRDLVALEREAAIAITRQIRIRLTPQETVRLSKSRRVDPEAQEAYFRGRYYWNNKKNREGLEKAVGLFQQAIARDPNYAQAYSGLADSYVLLGSRSFLAPRDAFPRAKAEALKALALDDTLAEAHAAPAFVGLYYDWDWAGCEGEFRRAIELNHSYANAHHWYSHYLIAMGRLPESLAESKRYMELDPLDPGTIVHLGEHYLYARQYDQAIEQLLKAGDMDPSRYRIYDGLGRAYEQKGMHTQAVAEFQKAVAASHEASTQVASLATGYAAAGNRREAMAIVRRLKRQSGKEYVPAYSIAEIYATLGDKDEAFAWLENAFRERSSALAYLKTESRMDVLRSDARFENLLQRMRLPQ